MREYDKDKLLNLIRKSVGTRNIKSFSEAAGLSADYMYRLLKGRFSDSPRKSTLKKISDASKGIVTANYYLLPVTLLKRRHLIRNLHSKLLFCFHWQILIYVGK